MKQVILALAIVLLVGHMSYAAPIEVAEDILSIPDLKTGVIFLPEEGNVVSVTTATILKYNMPKKLGKIDLDVGYAIDNKVFAGVAYELGSLKDIPGIELPIAKYLDLTIGVGGIYDFNNEQVDVALYATAIKLQF